MNHQTPLSPDRRSALFAILQKVRAKGSGDADGAWKEAASLAAKIEFELEMEGNCREEDIRRLALMLRERGQSANEPKAPPGQNPPEQAEDPPEQAQDPPEQAQDPPEQAQDPPKQAQDPPKQAQDPPKQAQDPPKQARAPTGIGLAQPPPKRKETPPDQTHHPPDPTGSQPRGSPPKAAEGEREEGAQKKKRNPLIPFLIKVGVLAAIFVVAFTMVFGLHIQRGNDMYPFLMDGDVLLTYRLTGYKVGDAVAYRNPETKKTEIARIVAAGSNEIMITEQGELLVNGYVPSIDVFFRTVIPEGSGIVYPYEMSQAGFFLLNDYRNAPEDSRQFGEVTKSDLRGKVVYVFRRRGI